MQTDTQSTAEGKVKRRRFVLALIGLGTLVWLYGCDTSAVKGSTGMKGVPAGLLQRSGKDSQGVVSQTGLFIGSGPDRVSVRDTGDRPYLAAGKRSGAVRAWAHPVLNELNLKAGARARRPGEK